MPEDYVNRVFETRGDRHANRNVPNGGRRQRSYSIERHYSSGQVQRVHVHDNINSGNRQFEHVIGRLDADGNYSGRNF